MEVTLYIPDEFDMDYNDGSVERCLVKCLYGNAIDSKDAAILRMLLNSIEHSRVLLMQSRYDQTARRLLEHNEVDEKSLHDMIRKELERIKSVTMEDNS